MKAEYDAKVEAERAAKHLQRRKQTLLAQRQRFTMAMRPMRQPLMRVCPPLGFRAKTLIRVLRHWQAGRVMWSWATSLMRLCLMRSFLMMLRLP